MPKGKAKPKYVIEPRVPTRPRQTVVFAEVDDPWEEAYLKRRFRRGEDVRIFGGTADRLAAELKRATVLSVFIKSKVDENLIRACPKLKLITTRSTGFDHIDIAAAKRQGITVVNVPTYGENTVAEHTFALILSLARCLRKAYLRTVQNDFSIKGLMGFDLKGKTLGVIGTGHIGLHVIRIGVGFGMKVLAYDVREQEFLSEVLNFHYAPLEQLLLHSDIISLHVPYNPTTRHLINADTIQKFKDGALLINTARGGLVDTAALVKALDSGKIGGAGLDVLEEEEFILEESRFLHGTATSEHWKKLQTALQNHVLLHRENVIYTPHMAFYSREAFQRILDTTVENIRAFFAGRPINRVLINA